MLTLNSIRIRNFRAIKNLTFTPQELGITGIFGPNGAGKTSVLTAVMFALYGVRPKGVTVPALRRIGSGNEECSVSVVFTHLGQKIEVIRELKAPRNNVVVNIYVDGQAEAHTSVGAADKWVQRRFGVDAEGFLTAFVVRQKELDDFIHADPAVRKKVIEKLAGVETINNALKKAREDEKDSRKTVDLLPGSQDQVDAFAQEVDYYSNEAENSEADLAHTQVTLKALNDERDSLFMTIEEYRVTQNKITQVKNSIQSLTNELPDIDAQLKRVSYVKEVGDAADVAGLRVRFQELNQQLSQVRNQIAQTNYQRDLYTQKVQELTSLLENQKENVIQMQKSVTDSVETVRKELELRHEQIQSISKRKVEIQSQNADLNESLAALHDSDDCPTCKTHLSDPEALRKQFRSIIENNLKLLSKQDSEQVELSQKLQQLTDQLEVHKRIAANVESVNTNEADLKAAQAILDELPDTSSAEEEVQKLTAEQEKVVELGSKAKTLTEDKVLYAELIQRRDNTLLELNDLKRDEKDLLQGFSDRDLVKAQKRLEETRVNYESMSKRETELTALMTEARVRFQNSRTSYKRAYDQWEKKKNLQEAHAARQLTTDMLEKFRQEVVSSIAPELSDRATELIAEMTNGDFTEIKLDEDFKASIVDSSGQERPVAWLSGGEESAVALALRLSVAFLISGGNPELLWLDEPLTAQDKDRRAAILSQIRNLPINQIIMINHAQEAQDIVDYEITLTKD